MHFSSKIKNINNFKIFDALIILFTITYSSHLMFYFPNFINVNYVGSTDFLLAQAQIQSITQAGPIGKTTNLGFPFGFTQWNNPEFGIIQSSIIYLFGYIPNITNFGIFGLINLVTISLNVFFMYLLSTQLSNRFLIKTLFIFLGGLTPFSLLTFSHPHVLSFFAIPATLYFLLKNIKFKTNKNDSLILFLILLIPSVFWINILFFIFLLLYLIYLILYFIKKVELNLFKVVQKIFLVIFSSFIINLLLYLNHSSINGQNGRTYWQSDLFGGKFSDFIVSSPFLNNYLQLDNSLKELTSSEINARMVGLSLAACIFLVLPLIFLVSYLNNINSTTRLLLTISQLSLLAFLVGGLGNFQAAIFALVNTSSPVRAWSRLIILIAILSITILTILLEQLKLSKLINTFYLVLVFFIFLDIFSLKSIQKYENNIQTQEVYGATQYLNNQLKPCPVLQLPIDTYFVPQSAQDMGLRYYWNGMIPYLILPDFKWTSSTYTDSIGWKKLLNLPTIIEPNHLNKLSKTYCAILFDTNFSQYQIDRVASLSTKKIIWPGLLLGEKIEPNFKDTRFEVVLLNNEFKKY